MNFNVTAAPSTGVYINNNYITVGSFLSAVQIALPLGISFSATPSLAALGLSYVTGGNPKYITGDPILGGLVTGIIANSETISIETINPTFTAVQEIDGPIVTITDTMVSTNPAFTGRGTMEYFITIDGITKSLGTLGRIGNTGGGTLLFSAANYAPGTYSVTAVYSVYDAFSGVLAFQANRTANITMIEWRPEFNLSYESASQCAGDCCGGTVGFVTTTHVNYNTHNVLGTSAISWTITDIDGDVTDTGSDIINNVTTSIGIYNIPFTPIEQSDYTLIVTIDNGVAACVHSVIIKACNYLTITKVANGCNSFTITNCSLTEDHTFMVIDVSTMEVVETLSAVPLLHATTSTFLLPADGVYTVTVLSAGDVIKISWPIFADCNVLTCLTDAFNKALCHDCKCKSKCKECVQDAKLSTLLIESYVWFSYQNQFYTLSPSFTSLDDSKLIKLQSAQASLERLAILCDECGPSKKGKCGGCK